MVDRTPVLLILHVAWHHHVPRNRREHDQGVDYVGTANDVFKVVAPPVRW